MYFWNKVKPSVFILQKAISSWENNDKVSCLACYMWGSLGKRQYFSCFFSFTNLHCWGWVEHLNGWRCGTSPARFALKNGQCWTCWRGTAFRHWVDMRSDKLCEAADEPLLPSVLLHARHSGLFPLDCTKERDRRWATSSDKSDISQANEKLIVASKNGNGCKMWDGNLTDILSGWNYWLPTQRTCNVTSAALFVDASAMLSSHCLG